MNRDFEIACGENATAITDLKQGFVGLKIHQGNADEIIKLCIEDIHQPLYTDIPSQFHDLIEIAAYVYSADQLISRTQQDTDTFGGSWRRNLTFNIPVREPAVWNDSEIRDCLISTLNFLSDDSYNFNFIKAKKPRGFQGYLDFDDNVAKAVPTEQIVMFSGGLDSLAGAIDEIILQKRKVTLVSHKSTPKNNRILRSLRKTLSEKAGSDLAPEFLGIRASIKKKLQKEYTQRTRSFLFASLGATIAKMLRLNSVRFYENGVISLNLPICAQVVGSRATRTTHPKTLAGFEKLISLLDNSPFLVRNPYIWKTKAEVIKIIVEAGLGDTIATSRSCAHTWQWGNGKTHCGTCSQCLDRRIAMLAAGAEAFDPVDQYLHDIFLEERPKEDDKILTAAYIERANEVDQLSSPIELISRFPSVLRAIEFLPESSFGNADKVFQLYKRHANEVNAAVDELSRMHATAIRQRSLHGDSLISIVKNPGHTTLLPAVGIKLPENFFWKRGNVWEARFAGGRAILIKKFDRGCEFLQYLVARPGQSAPVYEVSAEVSGEFFHNFEPASVDTVELESGYEITQGLKRGDLGDVADDLALKDYARNLRELADEARELRELGKEEEAEALYEELAKVQKAFNEASGRSGRKRKVKDEKKNLRDAVRNSIVRTISEIRLYDTAFGDHLDQFINLGAIVGYIPEPSINWSIRPVDTQHQKKS